MLSLIVIDVCFSLCVSMLDFYVSDGLCMFVCLHDYIVTNNLNSC